LFSNNLGYDSDEFIDSPLSNLMKILVRPRLFLGLNEADDITGLHPENID
jgi:hypothetical protein